MKMKPNLLPSFSLVEKAETVETDANTHGDPQTAANMRNWMECVRSRKTPNAPHRGGLQPFHRAVHERGGHPDRA
jgi:hypothetical protein